MHDEDGTSNDLSGQVGGHAFLAGSIGSVNVHAAVPRVTEPSDAFPSIEPPFVDRDDERSILRTAADPDGVTIVHVSGRRGVGKTSLTLYAADHDLSGFAGRRIHLSLAGTPSISDTISAILRYLGVDGEKIPPEFDQRSELYTKKTRDVGPILLLLDDVESAAQVLPLKPAAPGSVVIANSEDTLRGLVNSGRYLPLRPLTAEASVELLRRRLVAHEINAEAEDLQEIAGLCDHLPLAIRIAACLLITEDFPSAGELAAALRGDERIDVLSTDAEVAMRPVLDAAYDRLPVGLAAAYRALAAHPGPDFTAEIAAVAMDLPLPEARRMLTGLRNRHLVETKSQGRHVLPALVGAHARRRAAAADPEPERRARLARIVRRYAATAANADRSGLAAKRWRLISEGTPIDDAAPAFATRGEALAWQESERVNALAVVRAAQHADPDTARMALVLCEALWPVFQTWKYHQDWIETEEVGIRIAQRLSVPVYEATLGNQLAHAHLDRGELDLADQVLARARAAAGPEPGDPRLPAVLAETAGLIARARRDWETALTELRTAREGNAQQNDERGVALQTYQIATTLTRAGRGDDAVAEFDRARAAMAGVDDMYLSGRIGLELGRTYYALRRYDEATAELTRAADVLRDCAQPAKELTAVTLLIEVAGITGRSTGRYAARAAELRARLGLGPAE